MYIYFAFDFFFLSSGLTTAVVRSICFDRYQQYYIIYILCHIYYRYN